MRDMREMRDMGMAEIESERLRIREAEAEDLSALLAVYLSNPEFVAMNEGARGEQGYYDLEMFQRDWQVQRMMPGGHVLGIYLKETGAAVGQASYLEENPDDGMPWLGLLMIARERQRRGLGTEALRRLAVFFRAAYGWPALRLGVLKQNTPALAFWERRGFRRVADAERERAIVMEIALGTFCMAHQRRIES